MSDFDAVIDRNGPLGGARPVPVSVIEANRGKMPELMLDLWQTLGVGSWASGLFTVCVPDDFAGLLSQIFVADQDFSDTDCRVFSYTAFGIVFAWSERHGLVRIDLLRNEVTAQGLTKEGKPGPSVHALTAMLYMLTERDSLDVRDHDGKQMFSRASKALGLPGPGHAFGFFPALAMGGALRLENLRIVPAREHFLILAQLQQFNLVDYLAKPPRIVRPVR